MRESRSDIAQRCRIEFRRFGDQFVDFLGVGKGANDFMVQMPGLRQKMRIVVIDMVSVAAILGYQSVG